MKNAICYYRVSSEKQANDNTIESQKRQCQNYAEYNGFNIVAEFEDNGISGASSNRPGMTKMIEFLAINHRKGEKTIVIIQDLSRLARDVALYGAYRKDIEQMGGELHMVSRKTEDTPEGRYMDNIEAANAQYFRDSNRVKTLARMKTLAKDGFYQFRPPLGMKNARDNDNQIIVVLDNPRADFVRQAFERYATGEFATKHEITLFLQNSGAFAGIKLNDTKVAEMLNNEVYTGIFAYPKWDIPRQKWNIESLISPELFAKVQERLAKNSNKQRTSRTADDFPLSGQVCCEHCGHTLTGYYAKGYKGKMHAYYRCYNKTCTHNKHSIKRALVESAFNTLLTHTYADDSIVSLFEDVLTRVCKVKDSDNEKERNRMRADIETLSKRIDGMGNAIADATISGDTAMIDLYKGQLARMTDEKSKLESHLAEMKPLMASQKFRTAMTRGRIFFKKPRILWNRGTLAQKKRLMNILFLEKPRFSENDGFRTASMPQIFKEKSAPKDGLSFVAAPTGFEPVFSP